MPCGAPRIFFALIWTLDAKHYKSTTYGARRGALAQVVQYQQLTNKTNNNVIYNNPLSYYVRDVLIYVILDICLYRCIISNGKVLVVKRLSQFPFTELSRVRIPSRMPHYLA